MPHETDLPCTECGSALEERTETPTTDDAESLTLAVCPHCGTKHYPDEALSRLGTSGESRSRGGS
jgi:DNA-directed RNA polymerase subunit RPC12/RpoP